VQDESNIAKRIDGWHMRIKIWKKKIWKSIPDIPSDLARKDEKQNAAHFPRGFLALEY
jgi:hypothetical protein